MWSVIKIKNKGKIWKIGTKKIWLNTIENNIMTVVVYVRDVEN